MNTHPSASWDRLARALYHEGEYGALEKVAQYLPKGTHMESFQTGILILFTARGLALNLQLSSPCQQPGSIH